MCSAQATAATAETAAETTARVPVRCLPIALNPLQEGALRHMYGSMGMLVRLREGANDCYISTKGVALCFQTPIAGERCLWWWLPFLEVVSMILAIYTEEHVSVGLVSISSYISRQHDKSIIKKAPTEIVESLPSVLGRQRIAHISHSFCPSTIGDLSEA